ncbi:tryptophan repeat family protein [Faustovirus]|nr:hypothetical protein PRJ_Fausto_00033 [Faustovirus]AMN82970.1 tryptophan repeat family protein [Faustovirus]AMN83957.1 tryptophan repeat family protein [Faustovirus]AMN84940.1 tryptophan repeat family protein [Faustovirus]QBR98947.1 tryptophan repeat family protein [Faustovirus mariensis]
MIPSDVFFNIFEYSVSIGGWCNLRAVCKSAMCGGLMFANALTTRESKYKINIIDPNISCQFLHDYSYIINWRSLELLRLHSDVIIEFAHKLNLNNLMSKTILPESVIMDNLDRINPILLFATQPLNIDIVDKLHAKGWIPWHHIHSFYDLDASGDILKKYSSAINWSMIPSCNTVPDRVLDTFADNFIWPVLIKTQTLPAYLLIKYKDKYDINVAITYQEIPEEIIEFYKGAIDWCLYSRYQKITSNIKGKYLGLICYRCLAQNRG